jgi:hypothetical protein
MDGRATFTTVMSSPTMKRLRAQMKRTPSLRRRLSSSTATAACAGDLLSPCTFRFISIMESSIPGSVKHTRERVANDGRA